ncbi:MAG: cytochrome c oxidase subunit 3, partial [Kiloniellales bacterium]|nr:cytochrome c oxidase subunit 3 [Kiloniellales bacterium]
MSESHSHTQSHPYHMVEPSPWPALGALAAGTLAVGGVLFMHDVTSIVMIIGFLLVLATMVVWWRDVIREATFQGHHTPIVQLGLRYGMMLFIASEVMFFAAFFWAFFNASLFPTPAIDFTWPPPGVVPFDPFTIPFLNTMILLLSGCTVTWAHHSLREGDTRSTVIGLWLTVGLGVLFTSMQAYEYGHAAFGFRDGIYSSTFYMATGFVWPPEGVETFDAFDVPFLNTLILLLSGCTVTWAHHALLHGDRKNTIFGLALTVMLGMIFTGFQAYEYVHA